MTLAAATVTPTRRRRWRFALVAGVVLLLAAGAFVGWPMWQDARHARLLREAVTEVEAVDPHWRIEDIEAQRAAVPDAENSAPIIRRAVARVRNANNVARSDLEGLRRLPAAVVLADQQYRTLIDCLEDVEAAVGPSLALARYPRGRFPLTYAPDGISTSLAHANDVAAVHFCVLEPLTFLLAHEGDLPGAAQACLATLNLGRAMGDEPFLMSYFIRRLHANNAVRGLERVLGQGVLPESVLAAVQSELAAEAAYDPWGLILRGERATAFQTLGAIQDGLVTASSLRDTGRVAAIIWGRRPPPVTVATFARDRLYDTFRPDVRPAQAWALRHFTRLLETARLPWPERRVAAVTVATERASAPELARLVLLDDVTESADLFQANRARLDSAVATVAAERYRLRHGRWPASLAALVPDLLPAVPADPFDGRPLRYRRLDDGIVIYSLGPDGTDDGGSLDDSIPFRPGTDTGSRLWDESRRRQPPTDTLP